MPVLPVKREAGRGLLKVDGQGEVDGVTGGVERKNLEKRAFRGDCPSIIHPSSCRKILPDLRLDLRFVWYNRRELGDGR